jgi:hypothetical protein
MNSTDRDQEPRHRRPERALRQATFEPQPLNHSTLRNHQATDLQHRAALNSAQLLLPMRRYEIYPRSRHHLPIRSRRSSETY